ncbi:TOTE conflict system archaeo-eukaryotic primase domain-containing protein [Azohydromonas caseinilytica]|uniref:TOTE conflict system archaeo-eukaryotic primase domain-containing protein n=1 Tax=Azohydromonas caseinilytica TaxID=2728836 RepID=UPI0035C0FDFC
MQDDSGHFPAVDFNEAEWREDARAVEGSCRALGVPAALEIRRSGRGACAWVFLAGKVTAPRLASYHGHACHGVTPGAVPGPRPRA